MATKPSRCSTPGSAWARRSQIPAFVELYHRIKKHRAGIVAAVTHGLSNGLTESVNTKLRLLTRIAYGFRSTDNLIALCLLDRGGHCPPLPGRDDRGMTHGSSRRAILPLQLRSPARLSETLAAW